MRFATPKPSVIYRFFTHRLVVVFIVAFASVMTKPSTAQEPGRNQAIEQALCFSAPFDESCSASFAKGERDLFVADSIDSRSTARVWTHPESHIRLLADEGRFGGCLRFDRKSDQVVFYKAFNNFPNPASNGKGTVSFWLKTDLDKELQEGFCDPLQITSKQWDDAAFFVEFEKRSSGTPFRLGIYADKGVWNPTGKEFDSIPSDQRPLVSATNPPFHHAQWTHVAFTFRNFNSNLPNATSTLYLNGKKIGSLAQRVQTFTWNAQDAAVMLGLSYIGCMDDLAIFNRDLNSEEIQILHELPNGIAELIPFISK